MIGVRTTRRRLPFARFTRYDPGMVSIDITYSGDLHTRAVHGPSRAELDTDAPKDNQGKGEAYSPTDLLATSLGTCMLTTMGIVARREQVALEGARVRVEKEMTATAPRKVATLRVAFALPAGVPADQRHKLETAAHQCPVSRSLHPDVQVITTFDWSL
jgi:putative redox protein